jgi:hypothetical protein
MKHVVYRRFNPPKERPELDEQQAILLEKLEDIVDGV